MAPVGLVAGSRVVSGWFPPEVAFFSLFVILLLSVFLAALCTHCGRHSFELRDPEVEKPPSSLIRVVKLEDALAARENPMIDEIRNDEKEPVPESSGPVVTNLSFGEDNATWSTSWRSHTRASQQQDVAQISNGTPGAVQMKSILPQVEPVTDDIGNVPASKLFSSSALTAMMEIEAPMRSASPFPATTTAILDDPVLTGLDPGVTVLDPVVTVLDPGVTVLDPVETILDPGVTILDPGVTVLDPVVTVLDPGVTVLDPVVTVLDPVETVLDPVETVLDPVETVLDPGVTVLDPVVTVLDPVETVLDPVETVLDPVETVLDPGVTDLDPVMTVLDPVETVLDPGLTDLDPGVTGLDSVVTDLDPVEIVLDPGVTGLDLGVTGLDLEVTALETLRPPGEFGPAILPGVEELGEGQNQEPWPALEVSPEHIYDTIGEPGSVLENLPADVSLPELDQSSVADLEPASQQEGGVDMLSTRALIEEVEEGLSDRGWNPVYARVSRKDKCPTPPPVPPPEDPEEEIEEEFSPPLPDRRIEKE